jgi:hypothetical protein
MKGNVPVNDDGGLETEADVMGEKATQEMQKQNLKSETSIVTQRNATGFNNTLGTYPIQLRKIKLKEGSPSTFAAAMGNEDFKNAISKYFKTHGKDKVEYFAKQYFSIEGDNFSLDQFLIELEYDLETKSLSEDQLTLQERYMTTYGWARAANDPSKAKLSDPSAKLKLYRTMSITDWKEIENGNYSVLVDSHIGDFKQALRYFVGKSLDSKVMVEFTLGAGAEKKLFSTSLAFQKGSSPKETKGKKLLAKGKKLLAKGTTKPPTKGTTKPLTKLEIMANAIDKTGNFPEAGSGEGISSKAIGIKSESTGDAGFSIGIGGGATPNLFKELVESVKLTSVGGHFTNVSAIEADANQLLHVNNCLINAISLAARGHEASQEELITIRGNLNNYGEMLVASPRIIQLIREVLHIPNPIRVVYYADGVPPEDFQGEGQVITIYHVNGDHFTHEPQQD